MLSKKAKNNFELVTFFQCLAHIRYEDLFLFSKIAKFRICMFFCQFYLFNFYIQVFHGLSITSLTSFKLILKNSRTKYEKGLTLLFFENSCNKIIHLKKSFYISYGHTRCRWQTTGYGWTIR